MNKEEYKKKYYIKNKHRYRKKTKVELLNSKIKNLQNSAHEYIEIIEECKNQRKILKRQLVNMELIQAQAEKKMTDLSFKNMNKEHVNEWYIV